MIATTLVSILTIILNVRSGQAQIAGVVMTANIVKDY